MILLLRSNWDFLCVLYLLMSLTIECEMSRSLDQERTTYQGGETPPLF